MKSQVLATLALAAATALGCSGNPKAATASASLGSPVSRYCSSTDPCPGFTKKKLEVCGECDPGIRYFRQAMCSLDGKLRKAIDSCVRASTSIKVDAKDVFGLRMKACVSQRLKNEPVLVNAFSDIARKHKASDADQRAWRDRCDRLWAAHRGVKLPPLPAPTPKAATTSSTSAAAAPAPASDDGAGAGGSSGGGSGGGGARSGGGSVGSKRSALKAPLKMQTTSYTTLVKKGDALRKAGKLALAIKSYSKAHVGQKKLCVKDKDKDKAKTPDKLPKSSPCYRAMKTLLVIASTRKAQGKAGVTAKAYATYIKKWRTLYPKARTVPEEPKARYEMARALVRAGKKKQAARQYKLYLTRYKQRFGRSPKNAKKVRKLIKKLR